MLYQLALPASQLFNATVNPDGEAGAKLNAADINATAAVYIELLQV